VQSPVMVTRLLVTFWLRSKRACWYARSTVHALSSILYVFWECLQWLRV